MDTAKLISLKLDEGDAEESCGPCMIEKPEYPYGLEICLDEKSLQKLGIEKLPACGDMLEVSALAKVCAVSEREFSDEKSDRRVSLQITAMAVKPAQVNEDAAEKLYGKD